MKLAFQRIPYFININWIMALWIKLSSIIRGKAEFVMFAEEVVCDVENRDLEKILGSESFTRWLVWGANTLGAMENWSFCVPTACECIKLKKLPSSKQSNV